MRPRPWWHRCYDQTWGPSRSTTGKGLPHARRGDAGIAYVGAEQNCAWIPDWSGGWKKSLILFKNWCYKECCYRTTLSGHVTLIWCTLNCGHTQFMRWVFCIHKGSLSLRFKEIIHFVIRSAIIQVCRWPRAYEGLFYLLFFDKFGW